jgi:hypothetical protein
MGGVGWLEHMQLARATGGAGCRVTLVTADNSGPRAGSGRHAPAKAHEHLTHLKPQHLKYLTIHSFPCPALPLSFPPTSKTAIFDVDASAVTRTQLTGLLDPTTLVALAICQIRNPGCVIGETLRSACLGLAAESRTPRRTRPPTNHALSRASTLKTPKERFIVPMLHTTRPQHHPRYPIGEP